MSLISDLEILSNEGHVVAESYGVTKYPALIYYRGGYPILYPSKEDYFICYRSGQVTQTT